MKIQVAEITITRAEGPCSECGKSHVVKSYADAEIILSRMARTAPKSGGYDKCDFIVAFTDGETYQGRYDLKYTRDESLKEHMHSFVAWHAGVAVNPYCGAAKYAEFMARQSPQEIADCKLFLDTYDV